MNLNPILKKSTAILLIVCFLNLSIGCRTYYNSASVDISSTDKKQASLEDVVSANNYVILRKGGQSYALSNITFDRSKNTLTATAGTVSADHQAYLQAGGTKFSKSKKEAVITDEVHLFVNENAAINSSGPLTLPVNSIEKIEVMKMDKKRASLDYILIAAGVVAVAVIVILVTHKGSSPSTPSNGGSNSLPHAY